MRNPNNRTYANGKHSFMRGSMVSWTSAALPSFRFRFELLDEARCRSPGLRRSNLPVAVTLNRLATAFLVLRRATGFGMGGGQYTGGGSPQRFSEKIGSQDRTLRRFFHFWVGFPQPLHDSLPLNCYKTHTMGSLKKRRKAKIAKHKRKKRMKANRHKKRLRYKS